MSGFTRNEIETGRKLFAGDWQFMWAAASAETLPPMKGMEIAFAGRSNVGKSSLINAVTGRRALARTSNTPGRTQQLLFFGGARPLTLVDMPGRSEEHTSELQSRRDLVCRLLLEKKKKNSR